MRRLGLAGAEVFEVWFAGFSGQTASRVAGLLPEQGVERVFSGYVRITLATAVNAKAQRRREEGIGLSYQAETLSPAR